MADAIQDLQNLADDSTLQNQIDTVDANEHNTHRTNYRTQINLQKTVAEQQDNNYASATEPTLKSEGKIYADTTSDPAVLKYYQDGASNLQELVGTTLSQTLTNKTFTSPTFTGGANGNLRLGRDLNIRVLNNSINPTFQVDITYEYLTLYDENNLSYVESQSTVLTLDISITGEGGRAASEGGGSEQSNTWYYVYVYADGQGGKNGILSDKEDWSLVDSGDKPAGATYVRRISAVRNDSSSDLIYTMQVGDLAYFERVTDGNIGSTGSNSLVTTDISAIIPKKVKSIFGQMFNSGSNGTFISSTNISISPIESTPGLFLNTGTVRSFFEVAIYDEQTVYLATGAGVGTYTLHYARLII